MNTILRTLAVWVSFALTAVAPGGATLAAERRPGDVVIRPYIFELRSRDVKIAAEMGHLYVSENRANPDSSTIELAFLRFPTTSDHPGPPVVYLAGGPGASGIATAHSSRFDVFMALREVGDVIALDQRGVGQSRPNLQYLERWEIPLDRPTDPQEFAALVDDRIKACRAYFAHKGIDLSGYTTRESADDVDALREALGAEKIRLWGTSYGTHLAMAVIGRHGEHVDRAVLLGAEGPDHTLKLPSSIQQGLEQLDAMCKSDPQVAEAVPDLLGLVERLLARLESEPVTVEVQGGARDKVAVTVGKYDLQMYISQALGRARTLVNLPATLYAMGQGNFEPVARAALGFRTARIGSAMSYLMDCASGASAERLARIEREAGTCLLGDAVNFPFPSVCSCFGAPDLGPEFRGPLHSDVPVLFISGTLDTRTPISNAEELRRELPNSEHVIIENAGHDDRLFAESPEMRAAMVAFFRGESLPTTRIELEPLGFAPIKP